MTDIGHAVGLISTSDLLKLIPAMVHMDFEFDGENKQYPSDALKGMLHFNFTHQTSDDSRCCINSLIERQIAKGSMSTDKPSGQWGRIVTSKLSLPQAELKLIEVSSLKQDKETLGIESEWVFTVISDVKSDQQYPINQQDQNGLTLLHYAATSVDPACGLWLLEQGADPTICDNEGRSPAHEFYVDKNGYPEHMSTAFQNHQIKAIKEMAEPLITDRRHKRIL